MKNTQKDRSTTRIPARTRILRDPWIIVVLVLMSAVSVSCRRSAPAPAPVAQAPAPVPPAPAPTVRLTASPTTVDTGSPVTLEWSAQNASSVQIDPGLGTLAATGNRSVSPASSVTYTATATGPGGTATATVRVTVNPPAPARAAATPTPQPSIADLFGSSVQTVYFDYDRAEIRSDQMTRLQASARFLQQNAGVEFTISGHADERGSQEYNIGLGDRRANAVRQYLIGQGIASTRVRTVSYGEERPVCSQSGETCWTRNRRAEFSMR